MTAGEKVDAGRTIPPPEKETHEPSTELTEPESQAGVAKVEKPRPKPLLGKRQERNGFRSTASKAGSPEKKGRTSSANKVTRADPCACVEPFPLRLNN